MFKKSVSVGAVSKRDIQHLRIFHSLLQPMGYAVVIVFGFNDGNWFVCVEVQNVICLFGVPTGNNVAADVDFSVGKLNFGFHSYFILPSA